MYTVGIEHNLNRARIRKLLATGLFASVLTGVGVFLLGFAEETSGSNFAASVLSSTPNLADWQLIAGGLAGLFGIFLEGLAFFGIYRLMADAAPRYAHIYRTGILGYIWLAPAGCLLNMGLMNLTQKRSREGVSPPGVKLPPCFVHFCQEPVFCFSKII